MYPSRVFFVVLTGFIALAGSALTLQAQPGGDEYTVDRSRVTGQVSFLSGPDHGPLPMPEGMSPNLQDPRQPLRIFGALFGITDPDRQLVLEKTEVCNLGYLHHTFQQVHDGIEVFTGVVMVHRDRDGWPLSINGDFYPLPEDFGFEISVDSDELGVLVAIALDADEASIDLEELLVCDTDWWGDRPSGVRLAHHVIARGADALPHHILIDASNGQLLDRWPAFHQVINRQVYDAELRGDLPGNLSRSEGQSPTTIDDVDAIYDYLGDFHQFFDLGFDRDSIDGNGGELQGTARFLLNFSCYTYFDVNEVYAVFCPGFAVDDIIAHEFCHGLIINTADLIYQNQSGQLNESFADVFGELVDLWNGNCQEAGPPGTGWPTHPSGSGGDIPNSARTGSCSTDPSVRWLLGEDSSTGFAARDLWSPDCMGDPPNALHPLYQATSCNPNFDSGGVHSGSGVPNHAFAMATDGKNFNGYTVSGIGPIKSAAVWFRALTMYMTPATDFNQAYGYFNQAAADLVGTNPNDPRTGQPSASNFTLVDAIQIENALLAVEMNEPVDCCAAVGDLTCQTDYGSVEAGWTVNGYYDALEVTIDGNLVATLPGDAVGYSGTADIGNHTLDVIPVCTGTVSSAVSCTFDVPVPFTFTVPNTGGVFSAITGEGGFTAFLEIYENPGSTTYPTPTQGFSMDLLSSPPGNFTITEVLRTTALDELNGGNGPEFFEVNLFTESFSVEVVYGILNNVTLQFEESVPVVTANYQTVPGQFIGSGSTTTSLFWQAVGSTITVDGTSLAPVLVDGGVTMTPVDFGFIRGDCNSDGGLDVSDAIQSLHVLFSQGSTTCVDACDATDDGSFNIGDTIFLLTHLFVGGQDPSPPFPGCGVDPTTDTIDCVTTVQCD